MYKKLVSKIILLSLFVFNVATAHSSVEYATVDIERVFNECKAGKNIEDALKKRQDSEDTNLRKTHEALLKESEDLKKQQAALSADAFEKKRKVYEGKVAEFQLNVQKSREVFENGKNDALGKLNEKIIEIAKSICNKKSIKLLVLKAAVLYSDSSLDITDEILKELDKQLSKLEVKFDKK